MDRVTTSGDQIMDQGGATNAGEAPRFGAGRPSFGLVKDQGRRLEISFALKNGGMLTAVEELADDLTEEKVQAYSDQLAKDVAAGSTRTFSDSWSTSGQYAWINLGEVVAFSVRPAK